jgi:hypothetical protein
VEGEGVGGVLGHAGGVGEKCLLVELHERVDLLVENVGWVLLASWTHF